MLRTCVSLLLLSGLASTAGAQENPACPVELTLVTRDTTVITSRAIQLHLRFSGATVPLTLVRPGCTGSAWASATLRNTATGEASPPIATEYCDTLEALPPGSTFTLFPGEALQLGGRWTRGLWAPEEPGRYELTVVYSNVPERARERFGFPFGDEEYLARSEEELHQMLASTPCVVRSEPIYIEVRPYNPRGR